MQISQKLKIAVKLNPMRAYQIAHQAGMHPAVLSRLVCGIEKVKPGDHRVIAVGRVLGMSPSECFSETEE